MKAMARENSASFSLNMTENVENTLSAFGEFLLKLTSDDLLNLTLTDFSSDLDIGILSSFLTILICNHVDSVDY